MKELKQDGKFALLVGKEEWQEIKSKRTISGKTYALNGDAKQKKKVFPCSQKFSSTADKRHYPPFMGGELNGRILCSLN